MEGNGSLIVENRLKKHGVDRPESSNQVAFDLPAFPPSPSERFNDPCLHKLTKKKKKKKRTN